MANFDIKAHSGVTPSKKSRVLELTLEDVMSGIPFEYAGFRHLTKDANQRSLKYEKVVIAHAGKRKVVKVDGMSTRPYWESPKGQKLGYAEEKMI